MRRLCLFLLTLLFATEPTRGLASPWQGHSIRVGAGIGSSRITPKTGAPIDLQYGHRLRGRDDLRLTLAGDLTLNADRPMGNLMKGAAASLEIGTEWHPTPMAAVQVYAGASVGLRAYAEPGVGLIAHAVMGLLLPVHDRVGAFVQARGGVGVARVGDDAPATRGDLAADGTAGLRLLF